MFVLEQSARPKYSQNSASVMLYRQEPRSLSPTARPKHCGLRERSSKASSDSAPNGFDPTISTLYLRQPVNVISEVSVVARISVRQLLDEYSRNFPAQHVLSQEPVVIHQKGGAAGGS